MNEKEEENKENLNRLKRILDYLYDIDMLDYIVRDEVFYHLFNELDEKYLVSIDPDPASFSDSDDKVTEIKSNIIEWFGTDFGIGLKDGEYYFLMLDMETANTKYWFISKMKVDNLETAKKVGSLFQLLSDL